MILNFKTGGFSVNKYGDDHYAIAVSNFFNKTTSHLNFLTNDELRQIKNEINKILEDGDCGDAHDSRADAEQTSGMESIMER